MALSPADFYAYSRATGAPIPEDAQERAAMAPEVLEFRRNQLKVPQQESNTLQTLGTAALGLGAAIGAGLAARRFLGGRSKAAFEIPKAPPKSATAGVTQTDLSNLQRAAERPVAVQAVVEEVPASKTVTPSQSAPGTTENALAIDPTARLIEEWKQRKAARKKELEDRMSQAYSRRMKTAEELLTQLQAAGPDLTTVQQATAPARSNQFANAVQSGEDQMTGRMKMQLSRNEDLDMSQVELLENMAAENEAMMRDYAEPAQMQGFVTDGAINEAASQLPDGLPVDQAEGFREFSQRATQRKNLLDVQSQMWAFEEELENQGQKAQAWLGKQLEARKRREPVLDIEQQMYNLVGHAAEQGFNLEPSRALSLLTNPTIQMSAEEQRLFRVDPSIGKIALRGQTFKPGQQQTGASVGVIGEKLISMPNVGQDPSSPITSAASKTSIRGTSRVPNIPEEFKTRVSSSGRPVESDVFAYDEGGTLTWLPGEELSEIEFQSKDPQYTRYVRTPSTTRPAYLGPGFATAEEVKQGLSPEFAPKGQRVITTAEGKTYYVPLGDPGGVSIYGEERSFASGPIVKFSDPLKGTVAGEYTPTAQRAPTEMPFKEKLPGGAGFSEMSSAQLQDFINKAPEGRVRAAGEKELAKREITKQSLAASELYRRGRIEGLF